MSRAAGGRGGPGLIDRVKVAVRAAATRARWTSEDQRRLGFYSRFVSSGDLVFDVGANVGNRVKVFLRLGARVVAVEPQSECTRFLTAAFGRHPRFRLVPAALGATEGETEIMIAEANTISSMSPAWIEAVRKSGRFAAHAWDSRETVAVTTLDRLIAEHGAPSFIKIDVEGYEREVLAGLTRPVRALSFEFVPEFCDSALACVDHLAGLGAPRWNLSLGESMELELPEWVDARAIAAILSRYRGDVSVFGDVYARFEEA